MDKKKILHITPAILPKSYEDLVTHLDTIAPIVPCIQIDIVDGSFAPNKTWPYVNDPNNKFVKIVSQEEGMPYWEEIDFEIDLMVSDPVFTSDQWIAVGANRLIIHAKSQTVEAFSQLVKNITDKGVEVYIGVEIDFKEQVKVYIEKNIQLLSGIQCMGIDRVGFQHEAFDSAVLNIIKEYKIAYPSLPISVDGGVSLANARALYDAGASRLISGSSVFEAPQPAEVISEFEEIYGV